MAKIIITAVVLLAIFAGVIIVLDNVKVDKPTPTPVATETPPTPTPDFGTEGNIRVFSPVADEEVGLPLVIKGEARTFERAFSYRILDEAGKIILEDNAMSSGKTDIGEYDPFEVSRNYPLPPTGKGSVQVFEYSAKDGSEINKVSIPVKFASVPSQKVYVYFSNSKVDPNSTDCGTVYKAERRIPRTDTPIRATLEELLRGTTLTDEKAGYATSIPDGVKILGVTLENSILRADFSKEIELGTAGSCKVSAIRAQLEQTLKQFTSVKSVILMVEGKTEGILQP